MTAPTASVAQAHRTAGHTERAAQAKAARMAGTLRGRLLAALVDAGDDGLTVLEALDVLGLPERKRYSAAPRFPELVREGYAVKTTTVRDECCAYRATAAGRAWVARAA